MVAQIDIRKNETGVSESIGFMLIFSIIIAGIGLVTLYGYPMLLQQQVSADEKIMEKNMIVLQNDIKSLAYKTVPYKETSLKIGSGSLTVYNSSYTPSSSAITISDLGATYVNSFNPGELRFESVSSQTDISLQNGAVVMRPRLSNGSVMLSEPRWFYDIQTNTLVINLINITSDNIMAKEGIGTVRMTLINQDSQPPVIVSFPLRITFTPDNTLGGLDYTVAWDNYFSKTLNNPTDISVIRSGTPGLGEQLIYTISQVSSKPMRLVIKQSVVRIESI